MQLTYYAPGLKSLWRLFKDNHVNPEPVFSKYQLKYNNLNDFERRIPLKVVTQLWDDAYALIESPCFALKAYKYWHPSNLGALGYAWLSSATLREGLNRLSRYIHMLSNSGQISFQESNSTFTLLIDFQQLGLNPAQADYSLCMILHMCQVNYQQALNPLCVTFSHDEPECAGDYFAYFKSDVHFKARNNSITFSLDNIDKPLSGANKQLAQLNDQVIIDYLNNLAVDNIEQQIKALIVKKLPSGLVSIDMIAQELSMSQRQLQRKLNQSGSSFKKLFEQSRLYLAEKYIAEGKISMTEITFLLGFSELSSFSRAYKRWTGHSPKTGHGPTESTL